MGEPPTAIRTRIPSPMDRYLSAIVVTFSLASFSLASELAQRTGRWSTYRLYALLLALTAVTAVVSWGPEGLLPKATWVLVASLPLGVVAGEVALRSDRSVIRASRRSIRPWLPTSSH